MQWFERSWFGRVAEPDNRYPLVLNALSRRVARLEKQTGVRLFDRLGAGLTPTEAGREMAAAGERMEAQVLALNCRWPGATKA